MLGMALSQWHSWNNKSKTNLITANLDFFLILFFFSFEILKKTPTLDGLKNSSYISLNILLIPSHIHIYSLFHSCDSIGRLFSPVSPPTLLHIEFPYTYFEKLQDQLLFNFLEVTGPFDNLPKLRPLPPKVHRGSALGAI